MPALVAASARFIPDSALAIARIRRVTRGSPSSLASLRNTAGVRSLRILSSFISVPARESSRRRDHKRRPLGIAGRPHESVITIRRIRHKPTDDLDAYDYFLRAQLYVHGWTRESNEEALRLLTSAMQLDRNFAAAHAQATWYYCLRKLRAWRTAPDEENAETERLARRAVELGKDDAFALCWAGNALAYVVGDLDDGIAFIERALELNPNLARAWNMSGWAKIWLGEPDAAIPHFERAMRLSPLDPLFHALQFGIANAHFFAGRYQQACWWAEKSLH